MLGLTQLVEMTVLADARAFAAELLSSLRSGWELVPNRERMDEVEAARRSWDEELESTSSSTAKLMHPRRFLRELAAAIPKAAIVTTDVGNNCSMSNAYLKFTGPRQFFPALSWGNCGFAYGAALQGDGAWGISGLSEVMTAVREDIPVIAVIFQNHEWGAEKKNQIDYYDNRFVGTDLSKKP